LNQREKNPRRLSVVRNQQIEVTWAEELKRIAHQDKPKRNQFQFPQNGHKELKGGIRADSMPPHRPIGSIAA